MSAGFTLDPDEKIVRHIYHHWIDIASMATVAGVMILAAIALSYGYARYGATMAPMVPGAFVLLLVVIFVVLAFLILVFGQWIYRRNYMLLTNKHLIQVEQHGLFSSQVDQVSLGRIQDVSGKRPGLAATVFGYGTVIIQSAGEQRQFIFPRVPDPQVLADEILQAHEQFLASHPGSAD